MTIEKLAEGTLLKDRYEIKKPLGEGGTAIVYLAHDKEKGQEIALKVLNKDRLSDQYAVYRFRLEYKIMNGVQNNHIVKAFDLYEDEEHGMFFTMELMNATTLADHIEENGARISLQEGATILKGITSALSATHAKDYVHRDLKPENVLFSLDTGEVKLTDFGTALDLSDKTTTKKQPGALGSLFYMSPEQLRDRDINKKTDIYALGVIAYELFTGNKPFQEENTYGQLVSIKKGPPQLRGTRPDLPKWIDTFIRTATWRKPWLRYTIGDVNKLLEKRVAS